MVTMSLLVRGCGMLWNILPILAGLTVPSLQAPQTVASRPFVPTTEIRTTGTATRSIPPDLAVAHFEFSARDSTLERAARSAAAIGDAIRRAVAKAGIPEDSILGRGSVSYSWDQASQMEVKPNSEFKRYDTTYVFRDIIVTRIRDLKRVRSVLDAALAAGAHKLVALQFSSSRVSQAGQEALTEATRHARRNAELMAEAGGGKVGRPLELSTERDQSSDSFYDLRTLSGPGSSTGNSSAVRATPPHAELRVSVYGRWELLAAADSAPR
jgi:hypothetical protein